MIIIVNPPTKLTQPERVSKSWKQPHWSLRIVAWIFKLPFNLLAAIVTAIVWGEYERRKELEEQQKYK